MSGMGSDVQHVNGSRVRLHVVQAAKSCDWYIPGVPLKIEIHNRQLTRNLETAVWLRNMMISQEGREY